MDPTEMRDQGAALLLPVLAAHGFVYREGEVGRGSGGRYAQAAFVRGARELTFSTRRALGVVFYRLGEHAISHEDYMRAVAPPGAARYPGFHPDPLQAFRDLAADLAAHGSTFLAGSDETFLSTVARAQQASTGFAALERRAAR